MTTERDLGTRSHSEHRGLAIAGSVAAVAVVVAVAVAVGVILFRGSDPIETADVTTTRAGTPPSVPAAPITASPAPSTSPPPSSTVPQSSTPLSPDAAVGELISVSLEAPPPRLELDPLGSTRTTTETRPDVAIGDLGVVVSQDGAIASIGFSGERREIELRGELTDQVLFGLTYGPGDVVYGLHPIGPPYAFEMVAVPLSGELAGMVVARSEPLGAAAWVELPPSAFGHGVDGVIARTRDVGRIMIGYVDESGTPLDADGVMPHFPTVTDELIVSTDSASMPWRLEINGGRTPPFSHTGPPVPAPTTALRTVYATHLIPDTEQQAAESPVIAVLEPDGSGQWYSIPDGFDYAASDRSGTVFTRVVDGALEVALMAGGPAQWRRLRWEGTRIERNCVDGAVCTDVRVDADGSIVSYDPTTRTLTRHTTPPVRAVLPERHGTARLEALGPDHVAYLAVQPETPAEFAVDIVALTLDDDDAGREVGRWSGIANNVGDSDLVATRDGLVNVDCCDHAIERPAPLAPVLVPWVDRSGERTRADGPTVRAEVNGPELTIHRDDDLPAGTRSWTFAPPGGWLERGMPDVTPTYDGGFIAWTFGANTAITRGWTDGTIHTIELDNTVSVVSAMDPSGRILLADRDRFVRVDPLADRTEYWAGRPDIDADGAVQLPDVDTAIDFGAGWAFNPTAFGNAIAGRPEVNQRRTIEVVRRSESEFLVTVTRSNFFDDSVFADRYEMLLRRADTGRFRFVSGEWSQACQPGRGHQEFTPELCI